MQKINLFKKILVIILIIFCFSLLQAKSFAINFFKIKPLIKLEKTQIKSIRCNNCPCNCLIKPNETGECGQYKNINGKLTPVKNK